MRETMSSVLATMFVLLILYEPSSARSIQISSSLNYEYEGKISLHLKLTTKSPVKTSLLIIHKYIIFYTHIEASEELPVQNPHIRQKRKCAHISQPISTCSSSRCLEPPPKLNIRSLFDDK